MYSLKIEIDLLRMVFFYILRGKMMEILKNKMVTRMPFFDNLRFFFVFCVVLQHAGNAYIQLNWWPVIDGENFLIQSLVMLFDAFLMPSLFCLAGYFAIPSIRGKTIPAFLKGKLRRLGVPWLVCIITVCPILPMVYHYTRDGSIITVRYLDTWKAVMGAALQFNVGMMPPMDELMQDNVFYQRYMWFIGLLIFFFICFSVFYKLKPTWFEPVDEKLNEKSPSVLSTLRLLFVVGSLTLIGSVVIIMLVMFVFAPGTSNPEAWFTLGNVVQFRVSRIFLHVVYFSMGVLTYRNRWLEKGIFPGHLKTWGVSYVVLASALISVLYIQINGMGGSGEIIGLAYWAILNFLTITSFGLYTSFAMKFWNRSTPLNRNLAANSYNLYLAHYFFVIVFQLLLLSFPSVPVLLKFGFVSMFSVGIAYAVCQFMIRPYPKLTIVTLAGIFLMMVVFIHP